jgi:hypothetical protein
MAYSEFLTLKQVEKKLGVSTADVVLFPPTIPPVVRSLF